MPWRLTLKKSSRFLYWGVFGLLCVAVLNASGISNKLIAFSHHLDFHISEESVKKEAEERRHRVVEEIKHRAEEQKRAEERKKLEEIKRRIEQTKRDVEREKQRQEKEANI